MIKTEDMILINDHNEYLLRVVHNNEFCRPSQLECNFSAFCKVCGLEKAKNHVTNKFKIIYRFRQA